MRRTKLAALAALCVAIPLAASPVRVEIDAAERGPSIDPLLYGINTAHWDESLFPGPPEEMLLTADRDAIAKVRASGVTLLKYPGGNAADRYIWNDPANPASEMDTDEYIALCRAVGAEPFITVNFNGTPELAAEWVRYCNTINDYNVRLWEIGDEQWGSWAKGHSPPEVYAAKYIEFVRAMRAVDPGIKVAMNVPLGRHRDNWTERVLQVAGDYVDMLTFTFFPLTSRQESDEALLASPPRYREQLAALRRQVAKILGVDRASELLYINVGYNSVNHYPGPQTLEVVNALFTADLLGTMAETETDIACFWALHNAYPPRGGDYGYLSSEGSNTPSYSYHVFPMFTERFGKEVLFPRYEDPELTVYASRSEHKVAVFLINKNPLQGQEVEIVVQNFTPRPTAQAWILDASRTNEPLPDVQVSENARLHLPPYSLVALNLVSATAPEQRENLALAATASAASHSTIGPHFSAASAIDGLPHTRWESAAWTKTEGKEVQWLKLAWNEPQHVGAVRIHWGASPALEYLLEASADGIEWQTLAEVKEGNGGTDEFSFPPTDARFLRMNGRRGTDAISAYSIAEFEVFGPVSPAVFRCPDGGIIRGPTDQKKIALQFTGDQFAEGGETILDELARHNAQASFHLTGAFLTNPELTPLVRRIIDEGHYLGPHSDKHLLYAPWEKPKVTLVSREDFVADLDANLEKIERHGVERSEVTYWNPPYQWYTEDIVRWSREMGLTVVNFSPGTRSNTDYTEDDAPNFVSSEAIFDSIIRRENEDPHGLNGFLLLLHIGSGPGRTDKFHDRFGELLDQLSDIGYRFVRLDELLE